MLHLFTSDLLFLWYDTTFILDKHTVGRNLYFLIVQSNLSCCVMSTPFIFRRLLHKFLLYYSWNVRLLAIMKVFISRNSIWLQQTLVSPLLHVQSWPQSLYFWICVSEIWKWHLSRTVSWPQFLRKYIAGRQFVSFTK